MGIRFFCYTLYLTRVEGYGDGAAFVFCMGKNFTKAIDHYVT